jgi:hypothetical protein
MQPADLMQALLELADEVDLEVRVVRAGADGEPPLSSGVCRVAGRVWVVLSSTDPADAQISVLAAALVSQAGAELEDRFLAPAVREALDRVGAS